MPLSLYTLHETPAPGKFIIQKFDTDYNVESFYACTATTCMCPQGHKDRCRHRTMLPMFLKFGHIGDGWFLEWDTRKWRKPIHDMVEHPNLTATQVEEAFKSLPAGVTAVRLDDLEALHNIIADAIGEPRVGESTLLPSPGAEAPASPPSPPEGPQPSLSAEASEPARPVGVGFAMPAGAKTGRTVRTGPPIQVIKRRIIP